MLEDNSAAWRSKRSAQVKQKQHTAGHQRDRQNHEDQMKVVAALDRMTAEHKSRRNQEHAHESKKSFREWATIIAVSGATAVAVMAVVVSHGDIRRTLKDARWAARQQHQDTLAALAKAEAANAEATRTANAAAEQASVAREREQAELRAYVYSTINSGNPSFETGANNHFTATFFNDGETPAYVERAGLNWGIEPLGWHFPPDGYPKEMPPYSQSPSGAYVYKGHTEPLTSSKSLIVSAEHSAALKAGHAAIVFYGTMLYRDVFGCRHFANFCMIYITGADGTEVPNICGSHNDVDTTKECRKD